METKILKENIIISDNLALLKESINKLTNKVIIITDDNLYNLYEQQLNNLFSNAKFVVIPHGEENKNLKTIEYIARRLLELNVTRGECIIGFGGGVVLDMVGFLAGILYRGINFISIPTTLLAMVDASVGGKTGVDFNGYKNILGLFNEPKLVFINPTFLDTLGYDEYICGMGEVIKYKLLDKNFDINLNINDMITNSVKLKLTFVNEDFYDNGKRMLLNLGHTFGHHIEIREKISHGLAVLHGIMAILKLELDLGFIDNKVINYYLDILSKYNIKLKDIDYHQYLDLIFIDKKNIKNTLNLIFIDNDLNPYVYKTTKEELYDKIKNK